MSNPAEETPKAEEEPGKGWNEVEEVLGVSAEDDAPSFKEPEYADEGSETSESEGDGVRMHDQPFGEAPATEAAEPAVEPVPAAAEPEEAPASASEASEETPASFEEASAAPVEPPVEQAPPTRAVEATTATALTPVALQEALVGTEMVVGKVKLVIEQGMSLGKEFLLSDEELLIGRRDPEQDFIPDIDLFDQESPNNRYISRRQCKIYFKEAGLFIEDLESSNGTALNNHALKSNESTRLKFGDKVLVGQSVMLRVKKMG
ncbi:MAG: FHA domain-containing protein [Armatimonadetes bacterium]|nr:FHA domain-containing protein [Armatimonadota bacterium]